MRFSPSALLFAFALFLATGRVAAAFTTAPAPVRQLERTPAINLPDGVKARRDAMSEAAPATDATDVTATSAWGAVGPSNDPHGRVLLVWLWLLPISGGVSLVGYLLAVAPLKKRDRRA